MSVFRQRWFRLVLGVVALALSLGLSFLIYFWAGVNENFDRFNFQIKNRNFSSAAKELKNLRQQYARHSYPGLRPAMDKLLFHDFWRWSAAVDYLGENYEQTLKDLENRRDNYWALYLIGNAKFKVLQAAYQADKKQANRAAILKKVLEEVSRDFEAAVKQGPGPVEFFNGTWNYDLTSDEKSARRALENPKPKPHFILGFKLDEGKNSGGKQPGRKDLLPQMLDRDKVGAGSGAAPRKG